MPVINGKPCRARFTSLKIGELSSVDDPAQPGALMAIMKRDFSADERDKLAESGDALPDGSYPIKTKDDLANAVQAYGRAKNPAKVKAHIITRARALGAIDSLPEDWKVTKEADTLAEVAKYVCDDSGAHSFAEVLAENKFSQEIWPYTDALTQSIRSIVGDQTLTGVERETKISASVGEFLAAVRTISSDVGKSLSELIRKEFQMPKTVEQLEKEVGELTGQLTAANALAQTEKTRADTAETALATTKTELEAAKAEGGELATVKAELATTKDALTKATDETISVGGEQIRKSEVGEANFKLAKTLANDRQTAQLEKRAAEEFPHVVGTPSEKALILKTIDGKAEDDPTRKAVEAVLNAQEKMTKAGFQTLGTLGGQTETQKAAETAFNEKVDEIAKANPNMARHEVMEKVRIEHPAIFKAYQDGGSDAAAN